MKINRKIIMIFVCLVWVFTGPDVGHAQQQFDKFGGWTGLKGTKTGAFHTEAIHDRWWIVTPAGNVFWSVGVYSVRFSGIPDTNTKRRPYQEAAVQKYGHETEWARVTRLRLKEWEFNTIGDWSSASVFREPGFAYVVGVDLPRKAPNVIPEGYYGYFPDVFAPEFQQSVYESMFERFKQQAFLIDDPWLLGYFLADEPSWYGSKQRHGALTDDFIRLGADRPGKQAWVQFLKAKYSGIDDLNQAWESDYKDFAELLNAEKVEDTAQAVKDKLAFLKAIALQFSKVLFETLRTFDPHHMVLGTRPSRTYPEILEAIGEYTDVFGVSYYGLNRGYRLDPEFEEKIAELYSYTKKPILLGVIVSGQDAGLPYGMVKSQQDRGVSYWRFLAKVAADPRIVGMHWFQYFDPPRHCYDEKPANWGLVDQKDEPYQEAVSLIKQANDMVYAYALNLTDFVPDFDGVFGLVRNEYPQAQPEEELKSLNIPVTNGDFELRSQAWKLQTWKGDSRVVIDSASPHKGRYALKIVGGKAEGWDSVGVAAQYQPSFILKPGVEYKLSAWIKTDKVENFAKVRIKIKSESGGEEYYEAGGPFGTTEWTRYESRFQVKEKNDVEYIVAQMVGNGTAWFDDIQLEVMAPGTAKVEEFVQPDSPAGLPESRDWKTRPLTLPNPGFEQGEQGWKRQQWKGRPRVGISWFKRRTGLRSLEIKGSADGWDSLGVGAWNIEDIPIDSGKRYVIKAWIMTSDVPDRALIKMKVKYQNGETVYVETDPVSGTTDWTQVFQVFQFKEPGSIEYFTCQLVGKGTAWFDDISIEEIIE